MCVSKWFSDFNVQCENYLFHNRIRHCMRHWHGHWAVYWHGDVFLNSYWVWPGHGDSVWTVNWHWNGHLDRIRIRRIPEGFLGIFLI